MAYAALVSLAQTIDLILNYRQDSIYPQFKDQVISIDKYVILLQAFLEDFPDKANSLEARIRELAHLAEDIIELLLSDALLKSTVGSSKSMFKHQIRRIWEQIQSLYSPVGSSKSKFENLRHELKKITKEIESIAEKVMEIKSSIIDKDVQLGESTAASSSSRVATVHKDVMVGFNDDLMVIKSRLYGGSSKLEVIPIVGMGGIGKTTLARNVYDDQLIMEHFDIRAWVTVSQDYSAREIASGLLVSMKGLDAKNEIMEEYKVFQNLKSRRYLIVLDDIWSIKAWDDLKMMFPNDGNGSRIMLTTRLLDVAGYVSSSPVHEMRLMDDNQSWNLLQQKVFKQDPCPAELEQVGQMIAGSCRGLPLAIVVISGILAIDQTEAAWWKIAENVNSAISANDEQFDKILSLSYTHLPHHLRPCFLYMGGCLKGYGMRVSVLIRVWVAEGFLKPNGNKSFEETAEEYLEDLVKRSLLLVTERKSNSRIKSFIMHDLLQDMCIRKAQKEKFFERVCFCLRQGIQIRCESVCGHSYPNILGNICCSTVRTILRLGGGWRGGQCCLGYFRLLRIVDLSYMYFGHDSIPSLPVEIYELFHLRFLAFNCPFSIEAAISNLQNLQTLVICSIKEWKHYADEEMFPSLPLEIWRLPQLRHIYCGFGVYPFQKGAMFALENLQTLTVARNFVCSEEILKMIPNLKKLGIFYRSWRYQEDYDEDYQLHNLIYLQQLEKLKLMLDDDYRCPGIVNPAFPRTLKKLTLSGWRFPWEFMKIVGSLPNLEVLKLKQYACEGDTWETTEGEFSQLKCLLIEKSNLQFWITESSHFPTLKCLVLRRCRNLTEIPDDIGEIPTLELIEVDDWNKSLVDSAKQIQDYQQSCGNDALQVRYIKVNSEKRDFMYNEESAEAPASADPSSSHSMTEIFLEDGDEDLLLQPSDEDVGCSASASGFEMSSKNHGQNMQQEESSECLGPRGGS